jgi:hypothetical protein
MKCPRCNGKEYLDWIECIFGVDEIQIIDDMFKKIWSLD